jgi:carbon storage regulator
MLILGRKINERIRIGDDVVITVCGVARGRVNIGIEAPGDVAISREELLTTETPGTESGGNTEGSPRD